MNIPNFKTEDDRREYFTIYNRQLDMYARLFENTIKRLLGPDYKAENDDIFLSTFNVEKIVKQVMEDLNSDSGSNPA